MTPQPKPPLLLLGSGYTGRSLMAEASRQGRSAVATSRDQDRHLADISPTQRLRFDLAQPDTWKNVPVGADIIWCFPATPLEHVQAFAGTLSASSRRRVVLGNTRRLMSANLRSISRPGLTNQPRWTGPSLAFRGKSIYETNSATSCCAWQESTDLGGTCWTGSGKAASAHHASM